MPRHARIVFPGLPHHVVQRGNRRQNVFYTTEDREFYLGCFREYSKKYGVTTLAYCLMTNHVHFILVPSDMDGMNKLLRIVHSKYALRINKRFKWKGHLWQSRFFSCALDNGFLRSAVRYVELNPVRADMVKKAELHPWSSAKSHIFGLDDINIDKNHKWNLELPSQDRWLDFLNESDEEKNQLLRRNISRNLPVGSDSFIEELEKISGRSLKFKPQGRPYKIME